MASCGAGTDPFLCVGPGKTSWIRAGISHCSSADDSGKSWDVNVWNSAETVCRAGIEMGWLVGCPASIVVWGCLLNLCLDPAS